MVYDVHVLKKKMISYEDFTAARVMQNSVATQYS